MCTNAGLDGFVFTGGIGEHAVEARAITCERLRCWAWSWTLTPNTGGAGRISAPGSRVEVHVIPTDEETTIARHTHDMIT